MPRINLLPWRDEQRKERKHAFVAALVGAAAAAGVVTFAAYLMLNSMVDAQERRNDLLRAEIKRLDKQIEEINNLEQAKQNFIARMEIIEKLQRSRPEIVHLFDEIVRTLPDGVYLTSVNQHDKRLKFDGVAQSSTRVSTFMRNIEGSEWLQHPELDIVHSASNAAGGGESFTLYADQVSTAGQNDAGGKGKPKVVASSGAR